MVLSSALPVVSMTFDEVGAPAHLYGGPSVASSNIMVCPGIEPRGALQGLYNQDM